MNVTHVKGKLPRHSAGSMELKDGTGPITAMCSCGSFLEIYKQDKTFRIQSPESIDPDETNPNAPWVASPVADVGSANLTVARVLLQAREMLDAAICEPPVDKAAVVALLHSCKEALIACESLANRVSQGIDQIVLQITEYGISRDNQGRGLNPFPQVPNLALDCGAFLVQINRAIKRICELPTHFLSLERADSNFDYLAKRLLQSIGADSPITGFVQANTSCVSYLVALRNFHEHPGKSTTVIENFRVLANGQIQAPLWRMDGEQATAPRPIKEELSAAVDFVRDIAEIIFIHLLMYRISKNFPYFIEEVQKEVIVSSLPIRYRLSIDFSRIKVASPGGDA